MSTKTTFKRIALVAVASMGFGVLTSVAPASAANESANVDSISVSAGVPRLGETVSITSVLTDNAAGFATGDTVVLGARFITDGGKPSGSAATLTAGTVTTTQAQNVRLSGSVNGTGYTTVTAHNSVYFTPDEAGTYKVMVYVDADGNSAYTAGEKSATVTMTTAGAPTSVVLTKVSGGNPAITTGAWDTGALYSVVVKNAAGAQTELTSDEAISLTSSISTTTFVKQDGSTAATALGNSDMHANGTYYFYAKSTATAASSPIITATLTGAEIGAGISSSVTTTFSLPVAAATLSTISDGTATNTSGLAATLATDAFDVAPGSAVSLIAVGDTAAEVVAAEVTDIDGDLSGVFGAVYTTVATVGAADTFLTTFSFGGANLQAGHQWAADITDDSAAKTLTATAVTRAATTTTLSPATARVVKGSAVAFTGVTVDQYGLEVAGATVNYSVTGANVVASTAKISDAAGLTSFSYTPAASGTDTVASTYSGSATITVVDSITVGTIALTHTQESTAGTRVLPLVKYDISAVDGAEAGYQTITATVKDAGAIAIAGLPVTFSVAGTGCAIVSTYATVYTGATGTAGTRVYAWLNGTCVVTATAAGVSDTSDVVFAQATATEVRTISASASGGTITVTAKDRFGNPVPNVPVKATRTGAGNFAGSSSATGSTGLDGTTEFILSNGSASVTISPNDTVNDPTVYGQTDALLGLKDGSTATNIFTAYVAGTALLAEVGVGSTFAAAGVNSVKLEVEATNAAADNASAAADAAAEATDAANAATDAANAAAEAADAATAAAQDAADAVAALSTQVSEMVNALKKQITALTNLVIKIQKKVKA
jgi:hypothetical protein